MIQEWVYLGFIIYGLLSFMWDLAKLSLWIDDKRLDKINTLGIIDFFIGM